MNSLKKMLALGVASFAIIASNVQAGGFAILEQSTSGLGRSLAGMAADTDEPGALFFNPAVSAWFEKPSLAVGLTLLHVNAEFDIKDQSQVQGHDGGNGGGWSYIPETYYVHPLSDRAAFGLGFSATSGTATHWNKYWAGNTLATDTEIKVVNVTPSFSYKVLDNLSIGFGITLDYCDATLSRAMPNAIGHDILPGFGLPAMGGKFGQIKFRGDSMAYGFTAGVLYEPIEGTKVGLGFRSSATHEIELEGRLRGVATPTDLRDPMNPGKLTLKKVKGDADCDLDLPAMLDLGIQHEINEKWTVMFDLAWSQNSCMEDLTVKFKNDKLGNLNQALSKRNYETIKMGWRDNWKVAVGTDYKFSDRLTLRCGAAYDQTPVDSDETRVPSIPDLCRVWLSCGFSYKITDSCSLDFGYMKLFFVNDDMDQRLPDGRLLEARCSGDCDLFSTGLSFTF